MITEREHWLSITDDPDWRRNHIADPNISLDDTIEAIVSAFPTNPRSILEIGCGYGRLTDEIQKWFVDAVVTGMDINPDVLEAAIPGVMYVDSLTGLPVQDAIYSVQVFQHLPDAEKRAYIRRSYELLNPGGVLRVQFIEGARDNFCDHWVASDEMADWCHETGFQRPIRIEQRVHEQWSWLTAVK